MDLTFCDVSYTVDTQRSNRWIRKSATSVTPERNRILQHVSGSFSKGELVAIMGASGSGKTSIMDILANRAKSGTMSGEIYYDGSPASLSKADTVGYVQQDDVFLSQLTVRETLMYALRLRVSDSLQHHAERVANVESIIRKLNLTKVADTRIGSLGKRGISGGERRRLSIGVELVTSPSILFIDEITTGLDSGNALRTMSVVKDLAAKHGQTVICTIHQPRSSIFFLFDQIMLLDDGRVAYIGPGGLDIVGYFSSLGLECPKFSNPADFLIDLLEDASAVPPASESLDSASPAIQLDRDLPAEFETSEVKKNLDVKIGGIRGSAGMPLRSGKPKQHSLRVSWWQQLLALTTRIFTQTIRDPAVIYTRTLAALMIALLVGGVFWQQPDTVDSIGNRVNALLFLMCVFSLFCLPAISQIVNDRILFERERAAGYVSSGVYSIATLIVELPTLGAVVILYGVVVYWMCGLYPSIGHFLFFMLTIFLVIIVGFSAAQVSATAVKTNSHAIAMYMIILVYSLLMGGFIFPQSSLPSGAQFLVYTSWFYFGFQSLQINEFQDRSYGPSEVTNVDPFTKWRDLLALLGIFLLFRLVSYVLLTTLHRERK
ncbi:hypothetical protein SmJEL517_g04890 [Synchytrium microbalum]|uniref:ABC transporter domain-containing protein n=1 Tax=Synchytrium microbalum TaxID=1806994 RepID=A0A507BRU3_9FUNG|nr:uncharacterized protein SmJEL517_g04890 [Synchytrium microbalum]TPX31827.1 hypothetical protein SmJEL517_g04890 [Synchytrium microbalum]